MGIKAKVKAFLKKSSALALRVYIRLLRFLPLKNRVFFYSIRSDGELRENAKIIYDLLPCKKCIFAKRLPHQRHDLPKIYYYLLTSRVIVTDDYLKYCRTAELRKEQSLIQLWHACGAFKKFGLDAPSRLSREEEKKTHRFYSDVCVSSENVRKFYAGAFGLNIEKIRPLGVPRTDALINSAERERLARSAAEKMPVLSGKKVYLYCPTFRERGGVICDFDCKIDFERLSCELCEDEIFIIKQHPLIREPMLKKEYGKILESKLPTEELIAAADAVITDYSSVIYDSILCGKPVLFYCPDYESYERDFYLDFPADLPGEVITHSLKLPEAMRRTSENPPLEKMAWFKENQLSACDGKSAERIKELVLGKLK